jgi:restriction system protein
MQIHIIRAWFGRFALDFFRRNRVSIGYDIWEDIVDYNDREAIKQFYRKYNPNARAGNVQANAGQIYRFFQSIKKDDMILVPREWDLLYIGRVISDAYFDKNSEHGYFHRDIFWLPNEINRKELSIKLQNTLRSSLTCFSLSEDQSNEVLEYIWMEDRVTKKLESSIFSEELVIEKIRQKMLDLDAREFEILVLNVLQTLWFEASHNGKTGDGGIDVEGIMDIDNIASVKLQVQVKRYTQGIIWEKHIREFRWALKRDFQGTFITLSDFDKKARESANDTEKVIINLINGKKFVEIFIEHYDDIRETLEINEEQEILRKLIFKKTLFPL